MIPYSDFLALIVHDAVVAGGLRGHLPNFSADAHATGEAGAPIPPIQPKDRVSARARAAKQEGGPRCILTPGKLSVRQGQFVERHFDDRHFDDAILSTKEFRRPLFRQS